MKGAEQSYKHQTDEWQCELHLDPFICPNVTSKGEAEQWWAQVTMEKERFGVSTQIVVAAAVMEEQDLMRSFVPGWIPAFIACGRALCPCRTRRPISSTGSNL